MPARPFVLARRARTTPLLREIRAPWDDAVVALVCEAGPAEADEAAAAAHAAFPALSRTTTDERRRVLEAVSRGLLEQIDEQLVDAFADGDAAPCPVGVRFPLQAREVGSEVLAAERDPLSIS